MSFNCFCQNHSHLSDAHAEVVVRPPRRAEPPWPPKIPGARSLNNTSTITTNITELKTKTKTIPLPKPAAQTIKTAQHQQHQQQAKKQLQPPLAVSDAHTTPHNPPPKQSAPASPPHILPLQPPNNNNTKKPKPTTTATTVGIGASSQSTLKPTKPLPPPSQQHQQQTAAVAAAPSQPRCSSARSSSSSTSVNPVDSERLEKEIQHALNFLKTNLQLNGQGIPPPLVVVVGGSGAAQGAGKIDNSCVNGTATAVLSSNEEEATRMQLTEALRSIRNTLKLRLQLLNTTLADTILLVTRYLSYYDDNIRIEALSVIFQVILCFGDATLQYIDDHRDTDQQYINNGSSSNKGGKNGTKQQKATINDNNNNGDNTTDSSSGGKVITAGQASGSLIKELLKIATRHQENKLVQKNCNKILQIMAEKLQQERMMKILGRYAEDWSVPRMRAKAASLLVIVTYRIH